MTSFIRNQVNMYFLCAGGIPRTLGVLDVLVFIEEFVFENCVYILVLRISRGERVKKSLPTGHVPKEKIFQTVKFQA